MNRSLNLLLAVILFACPLWCAIGNCCCSEPPETIVSSCCCEAAQDEEPDSTPAPTQPQKPQQCICGGALLADFFSLEKSDVWVALFMPVDCEFNYRVIRAPSRDSLACQHIPARSGRMLRLMHDCWTL